MKSNKRIHCRRTLVLLIYSLFLFCTIAYSQAPTQNYLAGLKSELKIKWPKNRTINIVFHGHSVPTGYRNNDTIKSLTSYPYLLLKDLDTVYPFAVINVIRTSIGGENSEQGEERFGKDVLSLHPDVVCIDYALNDRGIGLQRSKTAMEKMIKESLAAKIKVILLTPSPAINVDVLQQGNILEQLSNQLKELAKKYNIGLADSYGAFKHLAEQGKETKSYLSDNIVHPNDEGHLIIERELSKYFK